MRNPPTRRLWLAVLLAVILLPSLGCLNFGDDVSTTTPTPAQIARCRAEMYLSPDSNIAAKGFHLLGSGIDDAIWFRFTAETDAIANVFQPEHVDVTTMQPAEELESGPEETWWSTTDALQGARYSLPNARFMTVHYADNSDGTLELFVAWFET